MFKRRRKTNLGGIIHTYQKYDPKSFPPPTSEPPDMVSSAFEHMLMFGSTRRLTEEELARAVRLDPSQIAGLGPSLDALMAHAAAPHMAAYAAKTKDMIASRVIHVLSPT